jgi:para-nitrobenzyl esterase
LFLFGHLTVGGYTASPGERALAAAMAGYWSRLAATGNPNGGENVAWPAYDAATDPYLRLDTTIEAAEGVRTANCDLWERLVAALR